jgi:acylphosphatase
MGCSYIVKVVLIIALKAKLTIKGERVQEVGYRLLLLSKARELDGFEAYNVGNDLVVYIEGDSESTARFLELAKTDAPPAAIVSEIIPEPYEGRIMRVADFRDQFNSEQLVKIALAGVEMKGDIKEMKGDIKEMKGDIKEMKGDIKEMKGDIKEMKGDIKEMKGDIKEIIGKQDILIKETRELRTDLRSMVNERLDRIEKDVSLIKQKIGL